MGRSHDDVTSSTPVALVLRDSVGMGPIISTTNPMEKRDAKVQPSHAAEENTPKRITISGPDDYLAALSRIVFQSGMGRAVVDAKWNDIVAAFDNFAIKTVAQYGPDDIDRLCQDERVIRNRRKIEAIVHNANVLDELEADPGFSAWLRSHPDEMERDAALIQRFKYLGPTGVPEFCWIVGEPTAQHR